jgi:hypothetical protein
MAEGISDGEMGAWMWISCLSVNPVLTSNCERCIQFGKDSLLCLPGARNLLLSALDAATICYRPVS